MCNPASRTRILSEGSAEAKRPAMRQAAAPPRYLKHQHHDSKLLAYISGAIPPAKIMSYSALDDADMTQTVKWMVGEKVLY